MSEDVRHPVMRVVLAVIGWLASLTLADVQTLVAICSGLIVAGYGLTQWYVLWRDKIGRRRRRPREPETET